MIPPDLLLRAQERLQRKVEGVDWLATLREARRRLAAPVYPAEASVAFREVIGGKERVLVAPPIADRLVEEALRQLITARLEPLLPARVHAWRTGRNTLTAAAALAEDLAAAGPEAQVVAVDIEDFFGSVPWSWLQARVVALVGAELAGLVMALVQAPVRLDGALLERERGLVLGRPLSPVLANLTLQPLDAAWAAEGLAIHRYGDDLAWVSEGPPEAVMERVAADLGAAGLRLNRAKTRVGTERAMLVWLGLGIGRGEIFRGQSTDRVRPPRPPGMATPGRRHQTLYLTQPGSLVRMEKGRVQVKRGETVVREVPLREIDRVLVLAGTTLTSAVIGGCLREGVPVIFLLGRSGGFGMLQRGGGVSSQRRRAQVLLLEDDAARLRYASALVRSKIAGMLRRMGRRTGVTDLIAELGGLAAAAMPDLPTARGVEGRASRCWFEGLRRWTAETPFPFTGRSRRPPRDPINSLLSFVYALLLGEAQTALAAHGLDPYLGLMHEPGRDHPALASDLMELYRVLFADTFVLGLVRSKRLDPEAFDRRQDGGVFLGAANKRVLLPAWEAWMEAPLGNQVKGASARVIIDAAARVMLQVIVGLREELTLPLTPSDLPEELDDPDEAVDPDL